MQSTALDLLFFNLWLAAKVDHPAFTERQRVGIVAERLLVEAPGLLKSPLENGDPNSGLGFSIFVRRQGRNGGIKDLLRD